MYRRIYDMYSFIKNRSLYNAAGERYGFRSAKSVRKWWFGTKRLRLSEWGGLIRIYKNQDSPTTKVIEVSNGTPSTFGREDFEGFGL